MLLKNEILPTEQSYLNIVSSFAIDLLGMNTIDEIVWHAAKNVVAQLGFEDVVIYLFNDKRNTLIQAATYGNKNPFEEDILSPLEISLGQGIVGQVALSQQAKIIADTRLEASYIVDDASRLSELSVPMVIDGKLIGVIDSEHSQANFYNEEQLKVVMAIASMMATQISHVEMVEQLERAIDKLEYSSKIQDSLFEIAELIFTTDNIQEFYKELHKAISRLTFANNFYIALLSEDEKSFIIPYCVDEKDGLIENEQHSLEGEIPSISGYVLQQNEPLLIDKGGIEQKITANELHIIGSIPEAWLGVPFGDESLRGIVVVQSYASGYIFTEKDKQLLSFVAKHIHNAIERMQTKSDLQFLALHDPLTQLPNRLLFTDRVEQAIVRTKRNNKGLIAVLFLDLDRFKQVNDTYGHYIGDQLLKTIATRIQECIRASDTLCRLGGDEFAVLLENIRSKRDVEKIANYIIESVQQKVSFDKGIINTSTSIGVTFFEQGDISTKDLLIQADEAMYRAKLNGRNQAFYYDQKEKESRSGSYRLERDFLSAIATEDLYLVFQPIIDFTIGKICSAEALIRWHHHEHGLLAPDLFLPELHRSGYLPELDIYVFEKAMAFISAHEAQLDDDFCLNINISGQGFSEPKLMEKIQQVYHDSNKLLSHLCIEITEQTIVDNVEATQKTIEKLHTMGVKVALDDFGTGYSSLSYINHFTFNILKIDRSFINNLVQGPNNTIILETIIQLSKSLGIKTVAEGIETQTQFNSLKALNCDKGQGYYMVKPVTSEELEQLLIEKKQFN
ncbi:EAL domain-containing protein [Colwellia sp. RSH04]|uniref:bifunctional diguanylate cyclase/phosphodiesterase n=1 Tax=Colwellia sp. RSH04 TaxID=2305464 RepID=UPI000E56A203|nr:EAL domain-containing protein [Colwellia sp. RSH04]RHW76668.1 EAL domain-containing protein [Colwellia sp. RSH04]